MQPLHETAAQSANNSNTGAPAESAPQTQPVLETGPELPIHASAAIFPPMRESEFEALVADIREKGQLEAVWLWQGQVIDGRHRVLACQKLGLTPKTREWDGQGSLLEFIVSANLRRRHLKENQRAMVAARMLPHFEEEAFLRRNVKGVVKSQHGENFPHPDLGRAKDHAGRVLNISGKSVGFARNLLDHGIPALIARVDTGQLAVSTAAKIAALPSEEQTRLLALSKRELLQALRPEVSAPPETPPVPPAPQCLRTEAEKQFDWDLLRKFGPEGEATFDVCDDGIHLSVPERCAKIELIRIVQNPHFHELLKHGPLVLRFQEMWTPLPGSST